MGWNINHVNFDNIVIQGKNLEIYAEKNQRITLWVEEEIKKATWRKDVIIVYLKCGETRKYLNHMHYITLPPTTFQKTYQFLSKYAKVMIKRFPRFSAQRSHGKYGMSPSANISR